jgi:hypothetical protein
MSLYLSDWPLAFQFLDFDKYPEWHPGYKVSLQGPAKKPIDFSPGDKVEIVIGGTPMIFIIIVCLPCLFWFPCLLLDSSTNSGPKENTPTSFLWKGSWRGLITGANHLRFLDDKETPGGTLFIQSETFSGKFQFLLSKWWPTWLGGMRKGFTQWYENFNGDLKARCESMTSWRN